MHAPSLIEREFGKPSYLIRFDIVVVLMRDDIVVSGRAVVECGTRGGLTAATTTGFGTAKARTENGFTH